MNQVKATEIEGDVAVGRHVTAGGDATLRGNAKIMKNLVVGGWLEAPNVKGANKGVFETDADLRASYPEPEDGWFAIVGGTLPGRIWYGHGGRWVDSGNDGGVLSVDVKYLHDGVERERERNDVQDQDISSLESRADVCDETLAAYSRRIEDAQRIADDADLAIKNDIRPTLAAHSRRIEDAQRIADDADLAIKNDIRPTLAGVVSDMALVKPKVAELDSEFRDFRTGEFADLSVDVGAISEDILGLKSDTSNLSGTVNRHDHELDDLRTVQGNHAARLEQLEGDSADLREDVNLLFADKVDKVPGKGLSTLDYTEAEQRRTVVDMWRQLGKNYVNSILGHDDATGLFSLKWKSNDTESAAYQLTDITYEEAAAALVRVGDNVLGYDNFGQALRFNLAPAGYQTGSGPILNVINSRLSVYSALEVCILTAPTTPVMRSGEPMTFDHCSQLRAVIGRVGNSTGSSGNPLQFISCPKLEYFRMALRGNMDLSASPLLTIGTFRYMVDNAVSTVTTNGATVTVHADVFAKLTEAGRETEWTQLLADAAAKKISFATR